MMKNVTYGLAVLYFSFYSVEVRQSIYIFLVPPFNGDDDYAIMDCVKKGQYQFDEDQWKDISP